jgi:hypothetical protein
MQEFLVTEEEYPDPSNINAMSPVNLLTACCLNDKKNIEIE